MAQFLRPSSNVTQTNFTGGFADIDEVTASDADLAWSTDGAAGVLEVLLSSGSAPALSTGHTIRYRIARTDDGALSSTGTASEVTVALYEGSTLIATDVLRTSPTAYTTYSLTLTTTQADSITDYSNLRLRFSTGSHGGPQSGRRGVGVSWAEFEIPDEDPNRTGTVVGSGGGDLTLVIDSTADGGGGGAGIASTITGMSPVAYWRLGDGPSDTTAVAEVGPNGTYVGSPTRGVAGLLVGDTDTAVDFTGLHADYIETASNVPTLPAISIHMLVQPDASSTVGGLISLQTATGFPRPYIRWFNLDIDFIFSGGGTGAQVILSTTADNMTAGTKRHIVCTNDGTIARIYIDGVLAAENLTAGWTAPAASPWRIGRLGGDHAIAALDGVIDEVAIWDRALTSTEVGELYTAATTAPSSGVSGSVAGSGGGDATVAASTARSTDITDTAGGDAAVAATTARSTVVSDTVGGDSTLAGSTTRLATLTGSGGGDAAVSGTSAIQEHHSGSLSASGGGSGAFTASTARQSALVESTGGDATTTAAKGATALLEAAGGGDATASAQTQRQYAITDTGGGDSVIAASTGRYHALIGAGGGNATLVAGSEIQEQHTGTVTASGGGNALLEAYKAAQSVLEASGGGSAAFSSTAAHVALLLASGGGDAVINGRAAWGGTPVVNVGMSLSGPSLSLSRIHPAINRASGTVIRLGMELEND